jgi:predicted transposase YbfD/YdcC
MPTSPLASFQTYFADIEDPRVERTRRHELLDILVMAICAVICGADDWVDVEAWGNAKLDWLRQQGLPLPNGIPSHDTFGDVFGRLKPEQFESSFLRWVQAVMGASGGQVVAVDGKTLRRSHDRGRGKSAIHLVSAWVSDNQLLLGQVKTDEKSNEITAIPALLEMLVLGGCIVTIDAIGTQKPIARTIIDQGADYVLALKDNQGQLHDDVAATFAEAEARQFDHVPHTYAKTINKGHGRVEVRECWTIERLDYVEALRTAEDWPALRSLVLVRAERRVGEAVSVERRYFISSRPDPAERQLAVIRSHWGIENELHWCLDVAFHEDDSRLRKGEGAQNFASLRRLALTLLKRETTAKGGLKVKRHRAGWDPAYLLKVLAAA